MDTYGDWRGDGWQEDCHTDVLHNFVDAMLAVPEWSDGPRGEKAQPEKCGFHAARYNANGGFPPLLHPHCHRQKIVDAQWFGHSVPSRC